MRVFKPQVPSNAVVHRKDTGPWFGNALGVSNLDGSKMNEKLGECEVKGSKWDHAKYCVDTDAQGNSVLTGDGGNNYGGQFTCTGLEVFLIE